MNEQDAEKWLIADDPEFNMNDEIVQSVLQNFNNTLPSEEIE